MKESSALKEVVVQKVCLQSLQFTYQLLIIFLQDANALNINKIDYRVQNLKVWLTKSVSCPPAHICWDSFFC